MPKRCVSAPAARRRLDDVGDLREAALAVRVQRTGGAIVVALHHLVHALGEREIGHGIADVHQPLHLRVDRVALAGGGLPQLADTGAGREAERIRRLVRCLDVVEQRQAVDDVARLDLGDRLVVVEFAGLFGEASRFERVCCATRPGLIAVRFKRFETSGKTLRSS